METLLAIIFIVFGVLQIILFFKIWGMTDDIREINSKVCIENKPYMDPFLEAKISYLKGDKISTKDLVDNNFFTELLRCYSYDPFDERYNSLVEKYKPIYKNLEIEEPDFSKFKTKYQFGSI